MTSFLLISGLIISLGLNILALLLIRVFLKRISIYETWILEFKQSVIDTLVLMREIDKQGIFSTSVNEKGIFESDDQVGQIFKELTKLIEELHDRTQ
jgi:hypothetical protein